MLSSLYPARRFGALIQISVGVAFVALALFAVLRGKAVSAPRRDSTFGRLLRRFVTSGRASGMAVLGLLTGFGLLIVPWLMHGMGAGDVKLMAAIGVWLGPLLTFYAFTIVILGGPGTLWGPVIGSVIFWFLFELLDEFMTGAVLEGWFGSLLETTDIGPIRFALFGIGLMWLMAYRPQGVFGKREEMLIDAR